MLIPRLNETRKTLKLKQKDIALFFELHPNTISGWFCGNTTIPLKYLIKYANHYNFSLDYLLGTANSNELYDNLNIDLKLIGTNLRILRNNNNLSLQEVAKKLNCHHSTLAYYETGNLLVSTTNLIKLKNIYKFSSFDKLLGRKKDLCEN